MDKLLERIETNGRRESITGRTEGSIIRPGATIDMQDFSQIGDMLPGSVCGGKICLQPGWNVNQKTCMCEPRRNPVRKMTECEPGINTRLLAEEKKKNANLKA